MTETHTIDIYPDNGGMFEGHEAEFNVEYEAPDQSVGDFFGGYRVEFISTKFGALTVTRDMLIQVLSRAEVESIEADVAERLGFDAPEREAAE